MSLDKLLALAGTAPGAPDLDAGLLLAAQAASRELVLLLASDPDKDGDDDSTAKGDTDHDYWSKSGKKKPPPKGGADGDEGGGEHSGHATYKAMVKRNVPPKRAAAMCARSDKDVKAAALAGSLVAMLAGEPGRDIALVTLTPASETVAGRRQAAASGHALADGSYPIEDEKHLHSAAVLAASGHGDASAAKALIRKRARELGVDVKTLPGFGGSDEDNEKAAASMVALARQVTSAVAMHHAPMTGSHSHPHAMSATHEHDHQHFGDNNHSGGPLHRPGSEPRRDW